MIVSIRNSELMSQDAAGLTAIMSATTAIAKSKKTLVIQLTPANEISVLNILYGKVLKEQDISSVYRKYEDNGLDALFLRAETTDLTTEHFNECVTPLFDKENLLDVLKPTKQLDYKKIINLDNLRDILTSAQETYDYVYIYIPFDDAEICEKVKELTDDDIVVVPQGIKKDVMPEDTVVVMNFDYESKFDMKYMKKLYNKKEIYHIPYNIEYKDSYISENILNFILRNKKDMKTDNNYSFSSSILALITKYVVGNNVEDDEEEEFEKKEQKNHNVTYDPLKEISGDSVQEVTVKKGLFKKEKKLMINTNK